MNLEETQKINRIAKELLAHHIVETSDEAMAKAEQMILGRGGFEVGSKQEAAAQDNNEIRYIHANIAQLHADIRRMAAEISSLKGNYEALKSAVASVKERNNAPVKPNASAAPEPSAPAAPVAAQQSKQESSPSRMGGFSDEQVAIDKIFYFGKK